MTKMHVTIQWPLLSSCNVNRVRKKSVLRICMGGRSLGYVWRHNMVKIA